MKINWGLVFVIIFFIVLFSGLAYVLINVEKDKESQRSCIEIYPLDSCELYKCRATYSNWIPDVQFNIRNYEICKIIINSNMSFNESLNLLETITYDS